MPKFEVRCYRTTEVREERYEAVDLTLNTADLGDAQALAMTLCRLDHGLAWALDPEAPVTRGENASTYSLGVCHGEVNGARVNLAQGLRPYPYRGAPASRPTDGQGSFSDERPRQGYSAAEIGLDIRAPAVKPSYDPEAERRSAAVAELLMAAPVSPARAIGLEPADPKELQNDAPGVQGQPIPFYQKWTPYGPDHLLNREEREEASKQWRDAYDRVYPGERLKQEEAARARASG